MSEIEKMRRYIERTHVKDERDTFCMRSRQIKTILAETDLVEAIILAFDYGKAKGYRAAQAERRAAV